VQEDTEREAQAEHDEPGCGGPPRGDGVVAGGVSALRDECPAGLSAQEWLRYCASATNEDGWA
jgi:hypothetical protein